jgi:WD40 repeat protein
LEVGSQDTRIYLRDWRARKLMAILSGHRQSVFSLDFSPDGKTLASGSSDRTVKLWNVALRREVATLPLGGDSERGDERIRYVGFSPDGDTLAACTQQGTLKVWRAPSWEEVRLVEAAKSQ